MFCAPDVARPATVPLKLWAWSRINVPDEIVIRLDPALPPAKISTVPPLLMVAPLIVPPDDTVMLPPETVVWEAVPPDDTTSLPPEEITAFEVVPPITRIKAPEPALVLLATP